MSWNKNIGGNLKMELEKNIRQYIERETELLNQLDVEGIRKIAETFLEAHERESTIYVFGNGGSASTASHMMNDFNKGISEYLEKKFHVECLNDNTATVLAVANDIGYEDIFSFQLKNKVKENDVVIGISGSGNSQNVVKALEYAKTRGAVTMGWVGFDGGQVSRIADLVFHVPVHDMQIVEDFHLILNHLLMSVLMQHWNIKKGC